MNLLLRISQLASLFSMTLVLASPLPAQETKAGAVTVAAPLITRTIIRREGGRLGYGGTLTLVGAPEGSITIEGWSNNSVEITAEIELRGETEADLDLLALVNGYVFDEGSNHIRIMSTGTHDKVYMRRVAKKFPKKLLGLPWKINYRIRVPAVVDLDISAGRGPITLSGTEGSLALTATESVAQLTLTAGVVTATIGAGKLDIRIPARSWRGLGADVRLAFGDLTVELPPGFNGDIDASVLRLGKIVDSYGELQPRQRPGFTDQLIRARAGNGGASFKFTVSDGTITIKKPGL